MFAVDLKMSEATLIETSQSTRFCDFCVNRCVTGHGDGFVSDYLS